MNCLHSPIRCVKKTSLRSRRRPAAQHAKGGLMSELSYREFFEVTCGGLSMLLIAKFVRSTKFGFSFPLG
jgi:hypothetical protein